MITDLKKKISKLSKEDKEVFNRLYTVIEDTGYLKIPKTMQSWAKKQFGSVKKVEKQKIVRIDSEMTFETALFNQIRSDRPIDSKTHSDVKEKIKRTQGGPFCTPLKLTPTDTFGRVKGKKGVSASNVAKYDTMHGLVVFDEHDPLKFTKEGIKDHLEVAKKWILKANKENPERIYPYIMWNCLWKAAASIVHGHMQMVVAKHRHYAYAEKLKMITEEYMGYYGTEYLDDIYKAHELVGLGMKKKKSKILCSLVPAKDKEVMIISDEIDHEALYFVLNKFRKMGVESFNVGIFLPPVNEEWDLPVVMRIVDRGNLTNTTGDVGGMEIFGAGNVISTDPYNVMTHLRDSS